MAADISRRVSPGDSLKFPAVLRNEMLDTIEYVKALKRADIPDMTRLARDRGLVKIKNNSGFDRDRFDILSASKIISTITPGLNLSAWKNYPVVSGEEPSPLGIAPTFRGDWGRWACLLQPLRAGAIGWGLVNGVTPAKVSFYREHLAYCDIYHGYPLDKPEPANLFQLQAEECGAGEILWHDAIASYPATVWCLVRIGQMVRRKWRFELKQGLTQYSGARVRAYRRWFNPEQDPEYTMMERGLLRYTTDCDWEFYVEDASQTGHTCEAGGWGNANMVVDLYGLYGDIDDLQCPTEATPDCVII